VYDSSIGLDKLKTRALLLCCALLRVRTHHFGECSPVPAPARDSRRTTTPSRRRSWHAARCRKARQGRCIASCCGSQTVSLEFSRHSPSPPHACLQTRALTPSGRPSTGSWRSCTWRCAAWTCRLRQTLRWCSTSASSTRHALAAALCPLLSHAVCCVWQRQGHAAERAL